MSKNNIQPASCQTAVSGSGFFKVGLYYKKRKSSDIESDYFFKCEEVLNKTDAFGIELVITPGKKLFHIHCSAHFIFNEWEEISKAKFLESTKKYTSQVAERFS